MVFKTPEKDYNSEFTLNNTQNFSIWKIPYEIITHHMYSSPTLDIIF